MPDLKSLIEASAGQQLELIQEYINPAFARQDLNCLLPLGRLLEMEASGEIGRSAPHHYSIMGYILEPQTLLEVTTPQIVQHLKDDQADIVVLIPA